MCKLYDPALNIAYIIYFYNKKGKKILNNACGNIDAIKEYCDKQKIDYSKCKENAVDGIHYLDI